MKKILIPLFAAALVLPAIAAEKGFVSIFDGKTLKGWNGDPKFWSVKDGAITGQTTKANPTRGNTFMIDTSPGEGSAEGCAEGCAEVGPSLR